MPGFGVNGLAVELEHDKSDDEHEAQHHGENTDEDMIVQFYRFFTEHAGVLFGERHGGHPPYGAMMQDAAIRPSGLVPVKHTKDMKKQTFLYEPSANSVLL
ncbi:hypothetical protein JCM14469_42340 [Desulfatiferula olefinivorans]